METNGKFQREYFMSLAPVYLITSSYLMQAALKQTSVGLLNRLPMILACIFSVLFIVGAFWLVIAAFTKRLPSQVIEYTYRISSLLGVITAVVFVIGWLATLNELLALSPNTVYIWVYSILGIMIYLSIIIFNLINAYK